MKYAWNFVNKNLSNGRSIPKDGVWIRHKGSLDLYGSGLHASKKLRDALRYASGNTLCRVAMAGDILEDSDKMVASRCKILWRIDAKSLLRAYARWWAIQVIDNWDAPRDVFDFLRTGIGRGAARKVAKNNAVRFAAKSAAYSAAWSSNNGAAIRDAAGADRSASDSICSTVSWRDDASIAITQAAWNDSISAQNVILGEFVREARSGYTEWELTF